MVVAHQWLDTFLTGHQRKLPFHLPLPCPDGKDSVHPAFTLNLFLDLQVKNLLNYHLNHFQLFLTFIYTISTGLIRVLESLPLLYFVVSHLS
jgi:hypothetical protein